MNEKNKEHKPRERSRTGKIDQIYSDEYYKIKLGRGVMGAIMSLKWRLTAPFRYYRPGDKITRFTIVEPGSEFDLSETGGIIPGQKVPLHVAGSVLTPFSNERSEELLKLLEAELIEEGLMDDENTKD